MHLLTIIGICALEASLAAATPKHHPPKSNPATPAGPPVVVPNPFPDTYLAINQTVTRDVALPGIEQEKDTFTCTFCSNHTIDSAADRQTLLNAWEAFKSSNMWNVGPFLSGPDKTQFVLDTKIDGDSVDIGNVYSQCDACMKIGINGSWPFISCKEPIFGVRVVMTPTTPW